MPHGRLPSIPRLARLLRQNPSSRANTHPLAPRYVRRHPAYTQRHGKAVQPEPQDDQPLRENITPPPSPADPNAQADALAEETHDPDRTDAGPSVQEEAERRATEDLKDTKAGAKKAGPMESVLYMGPPPGPVPGAPEAAQHQQHPYFVHYFDSYAIVNRLTEAGFTGPQSIIAMKAMRGILAEKMDETQDALVSKSDVDNETYLFKAACSELSTEVKNNRRAADEIIREQRMRLQHEVDVLGQAVNHELLTLKDTVRGLFDDRRMAVREEQKAAAGLIQQINYKISTVLGSDTKSDIEGLRWILIRRSALGIAFMAVVSLATLRYASYVKQQRQEEEERLRKEMEERRKALGREDKTSGPDAAEILAAA